MHLTSLALETVTEYATGAVELDFLPTRPMRFRAGQGGPILLPGGGVRPFTFASDDRSGRISIVTTLHSGSRYKRALAGLRPGARAYAAGPVGSLPDPASAGSQVFVAQGIGITPFLSMARSHDRLDATLLQVGTPHFFEQVAAATIAAEHHDHREGLTSAVRRAIADRPAAHWSLVGTSGFVAAVAAQLVQAGVPNRRIHKDAFWSMRTPAATTTPRSSLTPA